MAPIGARDTAIILGIASKVEDQWDDLAEWLDDHETTFGRDVMLIWARADLARAVQSLRAWARQQSAAGVQQS